MKDHAYISVTPNLIEFYSEGMESFRIGIDKNWLEISQALALREALDQFISNHPSQLETSKNPSHLGWSRDARAVLYGNFTLEGIGTIRDHAKIVEPMFKRLEAQPLSDESGDIFLNGNFSASELADIYQKSVNQEKT